MSRAHMQMQFSDPSSDHPCARHANALRNRHFHSGTMSPLSMIALCRVGEKGLGKVVVGTVIKIQTRSKNASIDLLWSMGWKEISSGSSSVGYSCLLLFCLPAWDLTLYNFIWCRGFRKQESRTKNQNVIVMGLRILANQLFFPDEHIHLKSLNCKILKL
jgi:hypothetical protein